MIRLHSSAFIGIVMAFLMFMGFHGRNVEYFSPQKPISFTGVTIQEAGGKLGDNKVRIEIFDDLTCDSCTEMATKVLPEIRGLEQETDEIAVQLYFIPDLNEAIYEKAAVSLKCAALQERFWRMYEKIHLSKDELDLLSFRAFAREMELDLPAFDDCLKDPLQTEAVRRDLEYASSKKIERLPVTLVGIRRLTGYHPPENLLRIINEELARSHQQESMSEAVTDLQMELQNEIPSLKQSSDESVGFPEVVPSIGL
jgi:predicted DsbA family dithiol-disulfide isomerase